MNRQEIIDSWNAQADEYNQWDDLGEDEKLDWAMQMEREACAKVCEAEFVSADETQAPEDYAYNDACKHCADAIRARGQQ